jgi:hypothetical protein
METYSPRLDHRGSSDFQVLDDVWCFISGD